MTRREFLQLIGSSVAAYAVDWRGSFSALVKPKQPTLSVEAELFTQYCRHIRVFERLMIDNQVSLTGTKVDKIKQVTEWAASAADFLEALEQMPQQELVASARRLHQSTGGQQWLENQGFADWRSVADYIGSPGHPGYLERTYDSASSWRAIQHAGTKAATKQQQPPKSMPTIEQRARLRLHSARQHMTRDAINHGPLIVEAAQYCR